MKRSNDCVNKTWNTVIQVPNSLMRIHVQNFRIKRRWLQSNYHYSFVLVGVARDEDAADFLYKDQMELPQQQFQ